MTVPASEGLIEPNMGKPVWGENQFDSQDSGLTGVSIEFVQIFRAKRPEMVTRISPDSLSIPWALQADVSGKFLIGWGALAVF